MEIKCLYDELVDINSLRLHPKNANIHPVDQVKRLAKILNYQGWRYPVKVSKRSGLVTSGHGRIEAARINKWPSVPVNFQDYESDDQELADLHADNAISSWADLDFKIINSTMGDFGPDFDIDFLGIKNWALDLGEKIKEEEKEEETEKIPKEKKCPSCGYEL